MLQFKWKGLHYIINVSVCTLFLQRHPASFWDIFEQFLSKMSRFVLILLAKNRNQRKVSFLNETLSCVLIGYGLWPWIYIVRQAQGLAIRDTDCFFIVRFQEVPARSNKVLVSCPVEIYKINLFSIQSSKFRSKTK